MLILILVDLVLKFGDCLATLLKFLLKVFIKSLCTLKFKLNPVHFRQFELIFGLLRLQLASKFS